MLTEHPEGKLLFWGARHLGGGGGESVKPVTQVTKPYYRLLDCFLFLFFKTPAQET